MTDILALLNVESAYGPIRAIRGVSLKVRQGEIATVLGSNGAGKTTILRTISGIIDPRRGGNAQDAITNVTPEVEIVNYASLPRSERKTRRVFDNREV